MRLRSRTGSGWLLVLALIAGCAESAEPADAGRMYVYVDSGPEPERGPADYCRIVYDCEVVDNPIPTSAEDYLGACIPFATERWDAVQSEYCENLWSYSDCNYADCITERTEI